jgi:hypothetical protein
MTVPLMDGFFLCAAHVLAKLQLDRAINQMTLTEESISVHSR